MSDSADLTRCMPSGLTQQETDYVYNVEVLGLPTRKAASMAGLPLGLITKPHIMQARELARREIRGSMQLTKEDVSFGIQDAIGRAKILGDPMTEIIGWEKLAKLHGFDAPTKIDVNISASVEVLQANVRQLSDAELVKQLGAGAIIDGEFYEVDKNKD